MTFDTGSVTNTAVCHKLCQLAINLKKSVLTDVLDLAGKCTIPVCPYLNYYQTLPLLPKDFSRARFRAFCHVLLNVHLLKVSPKVSYIVQNAVINLYLLQQVVKVLLCSRLESVLKEVSEHLTLFAVGKQRLTCMCTVVIFLAHCFVTHHFHASLPTNVIFTDLLVPQEKTGIPAFPW